MNIGNNKEHFSSNMNIGNNKEHFSSNMNIGNNKEHFSSCFFHPNQQLIGVCPFCLNERLLILASSTRGGFSRKKLAIKKLPKIFALGSLLHRLEFMHWKKQNSDILDVSVSAGQDDSFISIKFEENGVASWEKGNVKSKVSIEHCSKSWYPTLTKEVPSKSVIEHAKPHASLRWRKRIGHLSHLIKWKRSSKQCEPHGKQGNWKQLDKEGVDKDSDKEDQRINGVFLDRKEH